MDVVWHITDQPSLVLDPEYAPKGYEGYTHKPGFFVTPNPELWNFLWGPRKYAVEVDISHLKPGEIIPLGYEGDDREQWLIKPEGYERVHLTRVVPIKTAITEARRRGYGFAMVGPDAINPRLMHLVDTRKWGSYDTVCGGVVGSIMRWTTQKMAKQFVNCDDCKKKILKNAAVVPSGPWYHGTSLRHGKDILTKGFGPAGPGQKRYGPGVYLTSDKDEALIRSTYAVEVELPDGLTIKEWSGQPEADASFVPPKWLVVHDPTKVKIVHVWGKGPLAGPVGGGVHSNRAAAQDRRRDRPGRPGDDRGAPWRRDDPAGGVQAAGARGDRERDRSRSGRPVAEGGYTVVVHKAAEKDLKKVDHQDRRRLLKVIEDMEANAFPQQSKRLSGALSGYYRIAVGDSLRICYAVEGTEVTVIGCGQHEGFDDRMERRVKSLGALDLPDGIEYRFAPEFVHHLGYSLDEIGAFLDGEEIGSLSWHNGRVEPDRRGEIHHVFVDERFRRKGLASELKRRAEEHLGIKMRHSTNLSGDGLAWSRSVGARTASAGWLINGKPYTDGVWIEVETDTWYRGADYEQRECPSRCIVVRQGDKWAWEAMALTFIGAPHEDRAGAQGPRRGTAKTLEEAQAKAEASLAKDHEFFRRYDDRQRAKTALVMPAKGLPSGPGLFYRVHDHRRGITERDAWSAPVSFPYNEKTKEYEPKWLKDYKQKGFSAFDNPWHLMNYVRHQGWEDSMDRMDVLIFIGRPTGERGVDGEPLVMPIKSEIPNAERISWSEFIKRLREMKGQSKGQPIYWAGEGRVPQDPKERVNDPDYVPADTWTEEIKADDAAKKRRDREWVAKGTVEVYFGTNSVDLEKMRSAGRITDHYNADWRDTAAKVASAIHKPTSWVIDLCEESLEDLHGDGVIIEYGRSHALNMAKQGSLALNWIVHLVWQGLYGEWLRGLDRYERERIEGRGSYDKKDGRRLQHFEKNVIKKTKRSFHYDLIKALGWMPVLLTIEYPISKIPGVTEGTEPHEIPYLLTKRENRPKEIPFSWVTKVERVPEVLVPWTAYPTEKPWMGSPILSTKTAGPGSGRIPLRVRNTSPIKINVPRNVVLDPAAIRDFNNVLEGDEQKKVRQALQLLEQGKAPLEPKQRELAGTWGLRIDYDCRLLVYPHIDGAWHCFYIGHHDYDEAERRMEPLHRAAAAGDFHEDTGRMEYPDTYYHGSWRKLPVGTILEASEHGGVARPNFDYDDDLLDRDRMSWVWMTDSIPEAAKWALMPPMHGPMSGRTTYVYEVQPLSRVFPGHSGPPEWICERARIVSVVREKTYASTHVASPVEKYHLRYDPEIANLPEVKEHRKGWNGWAAIPVQRADLTLPVYATERDVDDDPVDALIDGRRTFRPGYACHMVRIDGGLVVIDGHHRIAAALGRGDRHIDARIVDVRSRRTADSEWIDIYRGLVLGSQEFPDNSIDRYVNLKQMGEFWSPDREVARGYAGRGNETGVVLHAQVRKSEVRVRRNGPHTEVWIRPGTEVRYLDREVIRPDSRTAARVPVRGPALKDLIKGNVGLRIHLICKDKKKTNNGERPFILLGSQVVFQEMPNSVRQEIDRLEDEAKKTLHGPMAKAIENHGGVARIVLIGSGRETYVLAEKPSFNDHWGKPQGEIPAGHEFQSSSGTIEPIFTFFNHMEYGDEESLRRVLVEDVAGQTYDDRQFEDLEEGEKVTIYRGMSLRKGDDPTKSTKVDAKGIGNSWTIREETAYAIAERGQAGFEVNNTRTNDPSWVTWRDIERTDYASYPVRGGVPTVLRAEVVLSAEGPAPYRPWTHDYTSEMEIDVPRGQEVVLTGYRQAEWEPVNRAEMERSKKVYERHKELGEAKQYDHEDYRNGYDAGFYVRWKWGAWHTVNVKRTAKTTSQCSSSHVALQEIEPDLVARRNHLSGGRPT